MIRSLFSNIQFQWFKKMDEPEKTTEKLTDDTKDELETLSSELINIGTTVRDLLEWKTTQETTNQEHKNLIAELETKIENLSSQITSSVITPNAETTVIPVVEEPKEATETKKRRGFF